MHFTIDAYDGFAIYTGQTKCYSMAKEVNHRRHRWLGHVLRMEQKRIPKNGLRWNPPGKRKQGRPKMTLKKTFEGDLKNMERPREKQKRDLPGEKGVAHLSLMV